MFKTLKLNENFYWVGVVDLDLRIFDIIMKSEYGTTYNSYLLKTEKGNVLFETVKEEFTEFSLQKIEEILKPNETIDYIILNHTEPDHSGSLIHLLQKYPNATVIGTPSALNNIKYIGHISKETKIIRTNEMRELDLGNYHLKFLIQPYIHWPDTMMTTVKELKTLISCDLFGCHYAEPLIIDENVKEDKNEMMIRLYKYYFDCIMKPFKGSIRKALELIEHEMGFSFSELQQICVSHGPVIRKHIKTLFRLYSEWSEDIPLENKVLIIYGSSYGYTKMMAESIKNGLESTSIKVTLWNINEHSIEEIINEFESYKGLLIGSPTIAGDAIPEFYQLLSHFNSFIHSHKYIQCFGSFGWSGEGVKNLSIRIKQIKCKEINQPITSRFKPTEEKLKECFEWGKDFGKKIQS